MGRSFVRGGEWVALCVSYTAHNAFNAARLSPETFELFEFQQQGLPRQTARELDEGAISMTSSLLKTIGHMQDLPSHATWPDPQLQPP